MSNVSNIHSVQPYVSGKSIALSGQRLVPITYKTDKQTGVKKDSVCVSIPYVMDSDIQANLSKLLPAIGSYLQTVQADVIRELIDNGASEIHQESIDIPALVTYLTQVATGNRMSKEFLNAWFDEALADNLTLAVASKLQIGDNPTDKQVKQVNDTVETYKSKIASLSGSKTVFASEICDALIKALGFISDKTDKTFIKLVEKLELMKVSPKADLLAL